MRGCTGILRFRSPDRWGKMRELEPLIDEIYEAAFVPERRPAILTQICELNS